MKWLWEAIISLLPAVDWKGVVVRHGLATTVAAILLWEIALPLGHEFVAMVREMRMNVRDLTDAKLRDSMTIGSLVRIIEKEHPGEAHDLLGAQGRPPPP